MSRLPRRMSLSVLFSTFCRAMQNISSHHMLLMLWLLSKLEYEQAMTLFVKEFKEHINNHVAKTYLDPKHPENLGGRAAGVKATSSSTNGVKKRGGNYKTKTKGITAKLPTSEKNM